MVKENETNTEPNGINGAGGASANEQASSNGVADTDAAVNGANDSEQATDQTAMQAEIESLKDQLLRHQAEIQTITRKTYQEVQRAHETGVQSLASGLLTVLDTFERALNAAAPLAAGATEHKSASSPKEGTDLATEAGHFFEGISLAQREFVRVLNQTGVQRIEVVVGDEFDPNLQEAIAYIPSNLPTGKVVAVVQSGWKIGAKILRASSVTVSSGAQAHDTNNSASSK